MPIYDNTFWSGIAYASYPIQGDASDSMKNKIIFDLSSFVTKISNNIISYTLTHLKDSLSSEQNNVAFAMFQRATISHICNHKLSKEGISIRKGDKVFTITDEYKTMPLSRSVYEYLVMFYYLFQYADNQDQREFIWNSWKIVSKKNQIQENLSEFEEERQRALKEYKQLCNNLRNSKLAQKCIACHKGSFESSLSGNTLFTIENEGEDYSPRKLSYDSAWKYLYKGHKGFSLTYKFLSMHSHPTYDGLLQFYNQDITIAFPLYESCHFMTYLCRLYMEQMHIEKDEIIGTYTEREKGILSFLSNEGIL